MKTYTLLLILLTLALPSAVLAEEKEVFGSWITKCRTDSMTDRYSCILVSITNKIAFSIDKNGFDSIVITDHDFPGEKAMIRIDKNRPIESSHFTKNNLKTILSQIKIGSIYRTRYYKWPYSSYKEGIGLFNNDFQKSVNHVSKKLGIKPLIFKKKPSKKPANAFNYQGVNIEIANAMKRWGNKNIEINKKILSSIGKYKGNMDSKINKQFVNSVTSTYFNYLKMCKSGLKQSVSCDSYRLTKYKILPPVGSVIYELSSGQLKKEAGAMRIGD